MLPRSLPTLLALLGLCAVPRARAAEPTIARIDVSGNTRTRTSVILGALRVGEGDALAPDAPVELQRRLLNLRLFRAARVQLQPGARGTVVQVAVEERWTL